MHQRKWVAYALSRKSGSMLSSVIQKPLLDFQKNDIAFVDKGTVALLFALVIRSTMTDMIKSEQKKDDKFMDMRLKANQRGNSDFGLNSEGLVTFRGWICVLLGDDIDEILYQKLISCRTRYIRAVPKCTKIFDDFYWWPCMKKAISLFISEFFLLVSR